MDSRLRGNDNNGLNKLLIGFISLFFFSLANTTSAATPDGFADLAEGLIPAVVNISSSQHVKPKKKLKGLQMPQLKALPPGTPDDLRDFLEKFYQDYGNEDDMAGENLYSLGSGFVISPDGLIVTNYHVVEGAEEVTVNFSDESKYKAEVVGRDSKTDLALLKIKTKDKLPYVKFGDSDKARVGDWVIAIGNPFGLGGSVTAGIISARARDINAGPFDDFLQTDAAINRGNSGGPMFNMKGEVIGINTAIYSPSGGSVGIGFAVPSSLAQPIIEQLRKGGKIDRAWLGVKIQTVNDEIAESVGLDKPRGALVVDTTKGSPAEIAGIQAGDVILKFDGKDIAMMRKLPRLVADEKIGKKVDIELWRNGKTKTVTVTLKEFNEKEEKAALEEEEAPESAIPDSSDLLGMKLAPLNDKLKEEFGYKKEVNGLIVLDLDYEKGAAKQGIKKGDVILLANQKKVSSSADLEKAIAETKAEKRKSVLLQVYRMGDTIFVAVPVG